MVLSKLVVYIIVHEEKLQAHFEESLDWVPDYETRSDKERCKIRIWREIDIEQRTDWDEAVMWIVDRAEKFHEIFSDRLD